MNGNEVRADAERPAPFVNPWPALITGLGATVVALVVDMLFGHGLGGVRFVLLGVAVLAAATAVVIRPSSPAVLALAAFVALLASLTGPKEEWDSARMVLRILALVGGLSACVLLLPPVGRRVVVSLLILFHFGGIVTAVGSAESGWVPVQLYAYVYRSYLDFMYLTNAYHFYAPEPGPSHLLWFCIEYEQDPPGYRNFRWVKVPTIDRNGERLRPDGSPLWPNLEYTRRLSLAENVARPGPPVPPLVLNRLLLARESAGRERGLPSTTQIPLLLTDQYREPDRISRKYLEMYARHVAHTFRHEAKPHLDVVGVKIYTVIHQLILPVQLKEGWEPDEPILYRPFYQGEYDKEGHLKPSSLDLKWDDKIGWTEASRDPLLYWLIPILRDDDGVQPFDPSQPFRVLAPKPKKVRNYVYVHAGDTSREDLP